MANIRARFEKGVLKPLEPLDIEEGREVDIYVPTDDEQPRQPTLVNDTSPQVGVVVDESVGESAEDAVDEETLVFRRELWEDLGVGDPPPGMHPTFWWISNLHKKYPGAFDDVPTDLSINYKHYIYGHPKVSEEE